MIGRILVRVVVITAVVVTVVVMLVVGIAATLTSGMEVFALWRCSFYLDLKTFRRR